MSSPSLAALRVRTRPAAHAHAHAHTQTTRTFQQVLHLVHNASIGLPTTSRAAALWASTRGYSTTAAGGASPAAAAMAVAVSRAGGGGGQPMLLRRQVRAVHLVNCVKFATVISSSRSRA